MKFYSAWYCPFAQRVWMGLNLKGIDFELIETDPYNKTPEWMRISAGTGQVPVLVGGRGPVYVPDSLRGLEFIDAFYTDRGPGIYPADPAERRRLAAVDGFPYPRAWSRISTGF